MLLNLKLPHNACKSIPRILDLIYSHTNKNLVSYCFSHTPIIGVCPNQMVVMTAETLTVVVLVMWWW